MTGAESGSIAVVAEKPSVARDIAGVLGASNQGKGYLHGNGYVVTWAIGHLAALAQPHEIKPEWRQWRLNLLPMLPSDWPLVVYERTKDQFEVGRVPTPALAMVVERELAIRRFVPEDYMEVLATFHPSGAAADSTYQGTWFRERPENQPGSSQESLSQAMRLPPDGEEANRIVERARTGQAAIESIEAQTQRMPPPALYDLTELQRHANRLFGFSAQKTLDLAQVLYERYKLISYPRTDSRHLSQDVARTLPRIVKTIEGPYRDLLAPGTGERPLGRRFVDDSKVTDHHAIIPTTTSANQA